MLSQEEIDALLKGNTNLEEDDEESYVSHDEMDVEEVLSEIEIDALGEIGNISMGTSATTLSTLLDRKVNITTPKVDITTAEELADNYQRPFVVVIVKYKTGMEGSNLLILDSNDAKIISDLMMGRDEFDTGRDLSELDLSAVSEAMNQMIGSAATSLSEMFMKTVDIEPPNSMELTFTEGEERIDLLKTKSPIIKISFKMVIGDIIDSNIMQLLPIDLGKEMVYTLMNPIEESVAKENKASETSKKEQVSQETRKEEINDQEFSKTQGDTQEEIHQSSKPSSSNIMDEKDDMVVVKKPEFENFSMDESTNHKESIDLVGDIPIKIVVELGRTHRNISEILEFGQGTVIELDKLVGEALNIYANGKFIARGEVVVIDDNFGVRVTEVEHSSQRII